MSAAQHVRHLRSAATIGVFLALCACASGPDLERLDAIRALEGTRSGVDALCTATADADRDVRRAACQALGQIADPSAQAALARAALDADLAVAHAAAFALSQLDGAPACDGLVDLLAHRDAGMRVIAARALGRRRQVDGRDALTSAACDDSVPVVRAAAATALGCLGTSRGGTPALDPAQRSVVATALESRLDQEIDPSVRVAIAFALAELGDPACAAAAARALAASLTPRATADERWTRVFALRALAKIGQLSVEQFAGAVGDADPQLQLAALAALKQGTPPPAHGLDELVLTLTTDARSPHVRARAIEVCAARRPELLAPHWQRLAEDPAMTVRRAALRARAGLDPEAAVAAVDLALSADEMFDRIAAVEALAVMPCALALPRLDRALGDAVAGVRAAAVAALGRCPDEPGHAELIDRAAQDGDLAVREELANTLLALPPSAARAHLARVAFADRPDGEHGEARKLLLRAVVHADPSAPNLDGVLRASLTDPDLAVRLEARRLLEAQGAHDLAVDTIDRSAYPRVGIEVPMEFLQTRPKIELHTTKGDIVIALAPALAPVHCFSLCQLASTGRLDGRAFHRVVPDFVVQGGDARDDGYGNASWVGGMLRREINPLPFVTGTLGMPRTAEPDTGGGQLFITLCPAPWLDGAYTAFGRITSGLPVAESIEVGDRIVSASVISR